MKKEVQDKIDAIIKQAQTTGSDYYAKYGKSTSTTQDSLSKVIRNKKEADEFLTQLEALIKYAQEKK